MNKSMNTINSYRASVVQGSNPREDYASQAVHSKLDGLRKATICTLAMLMLFAGLSFCAPANQVPDWSWEEARLEELAQGHSLFQTKNAPVKPNCAHGAISTTRYVSVATSTTISHPDTSATKGEVTPIFYHISFGSDKLQGPYLEIGTSIGGLFGNEHIKGGTFLSANAEEILDLVVPGSSDLLEVILASFGLPPLLPLGGTLNAGCQLEYLSDYTQGRGPYGWGIGGRITGTISQIVGLSNFLVFGELFATADWPLLHASVGFQVPLYKPATLALPQMQSAPWVVFRGGFNFQDPLAYFLRNLH